MPGYSPTFVKVDPVTGLTFYDFEGHLKATGLDFDTAIDLTTIGATIRWLSAVNTAAQQVWGSRLRFIDRIPHEDVSTLRLQAFKPDAYSGPTLSAFSELIVAATETDTGVDRGNITATVGPSTRKILDQASGSDFALRESFRAFAWTGPYGNPQNFTHTGATGLHRFIYGGTGYANGFAPQNSSLDLYFNGALTGVLSFYFNQNSVHMSMGIGWANTISLVNGTTYSVALQNGSPGGRTLTSDAQDQGFALLMPIHS